jgi:hypothetical protein
MGLTNDDLSGWWAGVSADDVEPAQVKAKEYGAMDLVIIGRTLREMIGVTSGVVSDEEIGILFYTLGKIARAISAVGSGHAPSDDTWHDITVYSMMVRRIREVGQWP